MTNSLLAAVQCVTNSMLGGYESATGGWGLRSAEQPALQLAGATLEAPGMGRGCRAICNPPGLAALAGSSGPLLPSYPRVPNLGQSKRLLEISAIPCDPQIPAVTQAPGPSRCMGSQHHNSWARRLHCEGCVISVAVVIGSVAAPRS
jgi:hypothetical protein